MTITIHMFAGPSLPVGARPELPDVCWYPPVKGGDLLRLPVSKGDRICLVDGAFETAPAVRHKEILLLLAEGIPVYGAASMGALRAAEMACRGMIGIGRIYQAYAHERIAGDDWVAVTHAPEELGFEPLTLSLVDLACGLQSAVRKRILTARAAGRLLRSGGAIFYQNRDWQKIRVRAGIGNGEWSRFARWRKTGWVSQKSVDARACLDVARATASPAFERPCFVDVPYLRRFAEALDTEGSGFAIGGRLDRRI